MQSRQLAESMLPTFSSTKNFLSTNMQRIVYKDWSSHQKKENIKAIHSRFKGRPIVALSSQSLKISLISTVRVPCMENWLPAPEISWPGNNAGQGHFDHTLWPGLAWKPSQTSIDVIAQLVSRDCGNVIQNHPRVCQFVLDSSLDHPTAKLRLFNLRFWDVEGSVYQCEIRIIESLRVQRRMLPRQTSYSLKKF